MPVYIRPFKVSDLTAFVPLEPMTIEKEMEEGLAEAIEKSSLAVTGIRNGEVIGCGGVHPVLDNPSHGEIWLRLSNDCMKHKIGTLRWIKEGLKVIEETFPFEVLHAVIRCCFKESAKMVEHLGFEQTQEIEHEGQDWLLYQKRIQV